MKRTYEKLSHVEHILKRPDTYVGSLVRERSTHWTHADGRFAPASLDISPGLVKIFDEVLVNAIDQWSLNPKRVRHIDVTMAKDRMITVINDGVSIPIERHGPTGLWLPEMLFGHLLTSSNYDDTEERVTGGRNGYGAKLANVFSTYFRIVIENGGQRYTQVWENNMAKCGPPVLTKAKGTSVRIDFVPDWSRFGGDPGGDIGALIQKRTWDAALWCSSAKVSFGGTHLQVKSLEEYARMHMGVDVPLAKMHTETFDIVVGHSTSGQFEQVSFVNGIATTKGGTHVERVVSMITNEIVKDKRVSVRPFQIRASLFVFVRATLVNPTFSSQTKAECTSRITDASLEPKPKFIKDVLATGVLADLVALGAAKVERELKKTDGSKRSHITGIPKLDDANWAGTTRSLECTLVITEGDSAKALAVAGLSVVGRNAYGVYPLRGKPRNVRDASAKQVTDNAEFNDLKKILGLQHGKVYNSLRELRYGRLMIMTDADLDGSHIKGLVLNMFHVYWPGLITLGFVVSMVTPVIKAGSKWYFTEEEFRSAGSTASSAVKYYKGLGTSTSTEAKEYFKMIDRLTVKFTPDDTMDKSMVLAFAKSQADERKTWLKGHMAAPPPGIPYGHVKDLNVTDFVHRDLACFSAEDIRRSIPHVADGLKPSQRKVIYACLKRGLVSDMKVAQLSGYVAEQTAYHHGEASLQGTIINLAQNFVGANNVNLLEPSGQFGTRLQGGKDHASARYIFTRLNPLTRKLFDERDSPVLEHVIDDGQTVEPEFYVPVMPTILVNGAEGIGTGFSCYVPPFDPAVIRRNIIAALDQVPMVAMVPFFKGFTGKTTKKTDTCGSWVLEGTVKQTGQNIHVTELPPGKWIQDFKEHLDELVARGTIQSYENHSTESTPDFRIRAENLTDPIKDLGLTRTIHTSNMYLIGADGAVRKFASPEEILVEYIRIRHALYKKRKAHMLARLDVEATWLSEKARFIGLVTSGALQIFRRTRAQIEAAMTSFAPAHRPRLLETKTYQYSAEEIESLLTKVRAVHAEIASLKAQTVSDMWKHNLAAL